MSRSSSREVRTRVPFFLQSILVIGFMFLVALNKLSSIVGTISPPKRGKRALLGDLVVSGP